MTNRYEKALLNIPKRFYLTKFVKLNWRKISVLSLSRFWNILL